MSSSVCCISHFVHPLHIWKWTLCDRYTSRTFVLFVMYFVSFRSHMSATNTSARTCVQATRRVEVSFLLRSLLENYFRFPCARKSYATTRVPEAAHMRIWQESCSRFLVLSKFLLDVQEFMKAIAVVSGFW